MNSKQSALMKVAGLCGVLVPIVAFAFIALAIYHSPWFTWTGNWFSELAGTAGERPIWAARGIASVFFNVGIIIAGSMGVVCATASRKIQILNTRLGRLGNLLLFIDMLALCAIGVFPLTRGYLHDVASFVFFILVPLSVISIGTAFRKSSEKKIGWFMTLLGVISLCSFPLLFISPPWGGNAIIEMIPAVSISVCVMVFGISLLKGKFKLKDQRTLRENRE